MLFPRGRRFLTAVLALGLCLALLGPGACTPHEARWNVLLVTLDTTRADALGCYGADTSATPNLDALAARGTRFEQAIATSALTPVSHASILSGLQNPEHGLRVLSAGSGFRLPAEVPTLASVLHDAGYATAAVHSAFPVSAWFGFERGFDRFESFDTSLEGAGGERQVNVLAYQRRADETTSLVLDWLARRTQPYFLWVHYWDPHDAWKLPPAEYLPADLPRDAQGLPRESRALYAAEVRFVDHEIGRLLEDLRARGDLEHTLVVVVGDHGEGLGDHGWWHHRLLYQEQIRVPLLVAVPARAPTAPVAAQVRTIDIFPTVLELLGVRAPRPVSGRSLVPLLEGRAEAPRTAFADQINGYDRNASLVRERPLDDFLYAVLREGWKLVYRPAHPEASELFDLAHDPHELANRYGAEPDRVRTLLVELARQNPWVTAPFPEAAPAEGVRRARNVLQGLGYAGNDQAAPPASAWRWICPLHPQQVSEQNRPCPQCSGPRVPAAR